MSKAWFISGLIHAVVLSLLANRVAQRAQLAGSDGQIRLEFQTQKAAPPAAVLVMPAAARIADRRFVYVPGGADRRPTELSTQSGSAASPVAARLPTRAEQPGGEPTVAAVSLPKQRREPMVQATVPPGNRTPPRFQNNSPPAYPAAAVAARIEGTVVLRVRIASDGRVMAVTVAGSSGHAILDAAAVNAVKRWRGEPARLDGIAVESIELLPVHFIR